MKHGLALAFVFALMTVSGSGLAEAHVKHHKHHHKPWCNLHDCGLHRGFYKHSSLDGSVPLCGFNDGTYLRNRLECGFP